MKLAARPDVWTSCRRLIRSTLLLRFRDVGGINLALPPPAAAAVAKYLIAAVEAP